VTNSSACTYILVQGAEEWEGKRENTECELDVQFVAKVGKHFDTAQLSKSAVIVV
jgi:hypothetical protein